MISCLLFEHERLQTAKECNVKFDVTGWVGEGEATILFDPDNSLTNTVLYIPTLLCHESRARLQLSVVSCSLTRLQNGSVLSKDNLTLVKSNWRDPAMERSKISLSKLKSKIESSVMTHAGALSLNDVLLYIGNIDTDTQLLVNVKFVFNFQPAFLMNDPPLPTINCIFTTMMPCRKLTMQLEMTSLTNIETVEHYHGDNTTSKLTAEIMDSKVTTILTNDIESTRAGFVVTMHSPHPAMSLKSSCFSLLLDNHSIVSLKGMNKSYHGVQMLSSLPHQSLGLSNWEKLSPCEMLFLVDCSGSMSGKKMHCTSEALLLAIKSLPSECIFNVIAFGSKYRILFQNSMKVSTTYTEKALQFVNQLQACLGGTELLTPLRWFLKKPISDKLHRHIILITDGGVPNTADVLHTVTKYRHLTRCHTFALGPDISSELMAGIASETGGHYTIVDEESRLQTKVMEVIKLCLQPPVTNVAINWIPPSGYTADKPFRTPSTILLPGDVQTCFTGLSKSPLSYKNGSKLSITPPILTGFLLNERVQAAAELIHEKTTPITNRGAVLLRNAAWFKMKSLNDELLFSNRKKHTEIKNDGEEPPAKRPRLNGSFQQKSSDELIEEIVAISIASGVSYYPYTHFKSSVPFDERDDTRVCQLLPWNGPNKVVLHTKPSSRLSGSSNNNSIMTRKRPRHQRHTSTRLSLSVAPSFSLLAKRTASSVSSAIKSAVNIATFGYINMDTSLEEGGERIEDQLYYQNKRDRIHWDDHNRLILPKIYYKSHSETKLHSQTKINPHAQTEVRYSGNGDSQSTTDSDHSDNKEHAYNNIVKSTEYSDESANDSSNEDKFLLSMETDDTINTTLTDASSSLLLYTNGAGTDIRPDYRALIQLQLPSGGWPLIPAISLATGVPMVTIMKLPKCPPNSVDDNKCDVWSTVLALACLRQNFEHYRTEWDLMSMKGEWWVCMKKKGIPITLVEATVMANKLVPNINN